MSKTALERIRGKFVVFDGVDGCGKTTQVRLLAEALREAGHRCVEAKDPGGTEIGNRIRHVLLDYDLSTMDVRCETLLFMASRAQLCAEVIEPALKRGETVVCDRFISSTCCYQAAAGYDPQRVIDLGRHAVGETWPALTVVLNLPAEIGFERTGRQPPNGRRAKDRPGQHKMFHDAHTDAMESRPLEFHQRVGRLFQDLSRVYPRPVTHVSATGAAAEVHTSVLAAIDRATF